jgi:DNA-binding beta-propeller fold protein YncE
VRAVGVLAVLLITAACGTNGGLQAKSGGDYRLYEAVKTAQGAPEIAVIDSQSHRTILTLPIGTPSSDWKHLYSVIGQSLVDTDPTSGTTLRAVNLGGEYQLPAATYTGMPGGLSPSGHWIVVEAFDTSSHLLVVDTLTLRVVHSVDLPGLFKFDAISDDGVRLYLIEFLNGTEYYVRMYDLLARRLDPAIVVDKADGNQAMVGRRLSGVARTDGEWLFSMYVRPHDGPFIHALGLIGPFAFCIDLPGSGYSTDGAQWSWSIAMKPDGTAVYAANTTTGVVAVVDSHSFQVARTTRVEMAGTGSRVANAALVSPDGMSLVLGGTSGVVRLDTATLQVQSRALTGWQVWSVGFSPDGTDLFALGDGGSIAEISASSGRVTSTFDPGAGQPMSLMRVGPEA